MRRRLVTTVQARFHDGEENETIAENGLVVDGRDRPAGAYFTFLMNRITTAPAITAAMATGNTRK